MDKAKIVKRADEILSKEASYSIEEVIELAKTAAQNDLFFYARNLLRKLFDSKEYKATKRDKQNLAKYYYKDPSLSSDYKFEKALSNLDEHKDIAKLTECETAGLIGAIYKRKWYYDRDILNLEISKKFYDKGTSIWRANKDDLECSSKQLNDFAYCATNLAFINELLANEKCKLSKEIKDIALLTEAESLINEAFAIRTEIIASLANSAITDLDENLLEFKAKVRDVAEDDSDLQFDYATLIESLLGINDYVKANDIILKYNGILENQNWKKRTTIEQLHMLYDLKMGLSKFQSSMKLTAVSGYDSTKYTQSLGLIYNKKEAQIPSKQTKTGIALSGGGFRASYFHIGVLAALAENDKLKDIEVISCVSGGSILGAFYYLKLRNLLQQNEESQLSPCSYIALIENMIPEFHEGVQNNLRMKWFTNPISNLKIAALTTYSRTNRMAELYDKYFYSLLTQSTKIALKDTIIAPKNVTDFTMQNSNYERAYKVPQLILNTTSLNTGHNFQFASTWMGEPPILINREVDPKKRLRRVYYQNISDSYYKNYPLCNAVGASSCVPGLFIGLQLKDLYEGIDLKLVDGGVHDNQGITALIENECKDIYISDASGQLKSEQALVVNPLTELFRSTNVSAEHIRDLQLNDQLLKSKNKFYDSLHLMHLKKDLNEGDVNLLNALSGVKPVNASSAFPTTSYNINKQLQTAISNIRTDLDSFTDAEAYSLMYSGYLQTISSLKMDKNEEGVSTTKDTYNWKFKCMEKEFEQPLLLTNELNVGSSMLFKSWKLLKVKYKKITYLILIIALSVLLGLGILYVKNCNLKAMICTFLSDPLEVSFERFCSIYLSSNWKLLLMALVTLELFGKKLFNKIGLKNAPITIVANYFLLTLLLILSWIYLFTLNKLFNCLGKR